jgi:hypothetical protein
MIKAEIWNKITSYFNQVRFLLLQWAQWDLRIQVD